MKVYGDRRRVHVGKNVVGADDGPEATSVATTGSGEVWIGDGVILGYFVRMYCGHHDYTKRGVRRRLPHRGTGYDVRIGNGAWVASGVTLIGPCSVGEDAVVCAGSTVIPNTHIPAGEMWGGYPARFIKRIEFTD